MNRRLSGLLLATLVLVCIASCESKAGPHVLGKWNTPTGGTVDFRADGTATMAGPLGSREVQYSCPDSRTIEFSLPGKQIAVRWEVLSVGDEELVVKDQDGVETRLRRTD